MVHGGFMKFKNDRVTNYGSVMLLIFFLLIVSCKGSVIDPFVSQKIGTVTESQSASLSSDSVARSVVLLRVGSVSDPVVIEKNVAKIKEGPAPKWQSLTVKDSSSTVIKKLYSDLIADKSCVGNEAEVKELLDLYPSMIAICDKKLIFSLEKASTLTLSTPDKGDQEFTSWGINIQDAGGAHILIYSLYL